MSAYYNENDPFAAQWLRNLITAGHIAPGEVDERSIGDVRPDDVRGFKQCHFFAGIGGWSYALRLAGWTDEREVWTGSCPCQPFSVAGFQNGFSDKRHLWPQFKRLIEQRMPSVLFGEQVAAATKWLNKVRGDLEEMDYSVGAMPIEAASAGAWHLRDRIWFVANSDSQRWKWRQGGQKRSFFDGPDAGWVKGEHGAFGIYETLPCSDGRERPIEPRTLPLADGFPGRVERLRAYGNAIVPQVAAEFVKAYMEASHE